MFKICQILVVTIVFCLGYVRNSHIFSLESQEMLMGSSYLKLLLTVKRGKTVLNRDKLPTSVCFSYEVILTLQWGQSTPGDRMKQNHMENCIIPFPL